MMRTEEDFAEEEYEDDFDNDFSEEDFDEFDEAEDEEDFEGFLEGTLRKRTFEEDEEDFDLDSFFCRGRIGESSRLLKLRNRQKQRSRSGLRSPREAVFRLIPDSLLPDAMI